MATLEGMRERCDNCSDPLELGQIGCCDTCQALTEPCAGEVDEDMPG